MTRSGKLGKPGENMDNQDNTKEGLTGAILDVLKSNDFMEKLSMLISEAVSTQIKQEISKQNDAIRCLEEKFDNLKVENDALKLRAEKTELYSRKNNLRITGVPENENEDTEQIILKLLHEKLNLKHISRTDIEKCHRIGEKKPQGKRTIFVRLHDIKIRNQIYKSKKGLKGLRVLIREDLTVSRLELYKKAIEEFQYKNTWTSQGVIFITHDGKISQFEEEATLNEFIEKTRKTRYGIPESSN